MTDAAARPQGASASAPDTRAAPRILLVSNGYGEMAIARTIAHALVTRDPQAIVDHLPLVGAPPPGAWPKAVGPQMRMPSGGLVTYWNLRNIARDLRAGLIVGSLRQYAFLRMQPAYGVIVAVGDVYCVAVCLLFGRAPAIFVATAKSEYVASHSALERAFAKRARLTFARDAATAQALTRGGVRALFAGNVMMDEVQHPRFALRTQPDALHVAVLPGSRDDASGNARALARRLALVARDGDRPVEAFVALAPSVEASRIAAAFASEGIALQPTGAATGAIARGGIARLTVVLVSDGIAEALHAADIVLGQAGTGNEQAAGLGKPVIAAAQAGESPQSVGWYRMRQQRLLGDALLVLAGDDDDAFSREVLALVRDPARMQRMAAAGRERMGHPGAAAAIADAALAVARSGA